MKIEIKPKPTPSCNAVITVPGDKSISHRAVMFGSIAKGLTEVSGFLSGADCLSTISCFREMGIVIEQEKDHVLIHGNGLYGLSMPKKPLDVGNSGTTMRLLSGILSAQAFSSTLTGDASIQKRPMSRVAIPLKQMGAQFASEKEGGVYAPFVIHGAKLNAIQYTLPVASAQVKSAILLAGLYAEGKTVIIEPEATRDHTEIMLNYLGADIKNRNGTITCQPVHELYAKTISVPGDISSAAYFIVAALICPNSSIRIQNVGINPTRIGIITALQKMGASIQIVNQRQCNGEPIADILASSSSLTAITLKGSIIPKLIDEIPIFAVAACFAQGTTVIKDAKELKVKESDRIKTMSEELNKLGAVIKQTDDGMIIEGGHPLHGAEVESHHDHRVAMSLSVAALCAKGATTINNAQRVAISFPGFYDSIDKLCLTAQP